MNLDLLRKQIDDIDSKILELFTSRMTVSKAIGDYKKAHKIPILDTQREKEILDTRKQACQDKGFWPYLESLIKEMMRLSKEYQNHE